MESYRYQPLEGLFTRNKEDYKSISLLKTLEQVEAEISPSPKGRAKRLMLFFLIIDILKTSDVPFYVKGGLILQYYLKDHARDTSDIDVLIPGDPDAFYAKAIKAFAHNAYGLSIDVEAYRKEETGDGCYFPTFSMLLTLSIDGEELDTISFEGIYGDLFDKVVPKVYPGPPILKEGFTFLGVPVEYIFADKLLAITSELERPYKHLIDAYSISQIDVDIAALKQYLGAILAYENIRRAKLGIATDKYQYEIKPEKRFSRNYYFPLIQAGYRIPAEEMIRDLNQYMSTHLSE